MEFTYDNIVKWMKEYFEVYSNYGQEPETADRMKEYFAPDLKFMPYIAPLGGPEGGFRSRDEFIQTAVAHTGWYEKLTPLDITVDDRRKVVVVIFNIDVYDRKTGKVAVKRSAIAHYYLVLDEKNTIKIKTIRFFWEVLPTGVPEFFELYGNDRR
jgi:hypothetical protein